MHVKQAFSEFSATTRCPNCHLNYFRASLFPPFDPPGPTQGITSLAWSLIPCQSLKISHICKTSALVITAPATGLGFLKHHTPPQSSALLASPLIFVISLFLLLCESFSPSPPLCPYVLTQNSECFLLLLIPTSPHSLVLVPPPLFPSFSPSIEFSFCFFFFSACAFVLVRANLSPEGVYGAYPLPFYVFRDLSGNKFRDPFLPLSISSLKKLTYM